MSSLATNQHVGAGNVSATGEIKTDEGDLAGPGGGDAAVGFHAFQITGQCRHGVARITEQTKHADAAERCAGEQAAAQHVPAADRFAVAQIQQGCIRMQGLGTFF